MKFAFVAKAPFGLTCRWHGSAKRWGSLVLAFMPGSTVLRADSAKQDEVLLDKIKDSLPRQ